MFKKIFIAFNNFLLMFGASVYMGLWWALHLIWYPSWRTVRLDNVAEHFINPIDNAINFFTVLVGIMLFTNLVLIKTEWRTPFRWMCILVLLLLTIVTYLFKVEILPVIEQIRAGLPTQELLKAKMEIWMQLNDIRWYYYSAIWSLLMIYFLLKQYKVS